MKKLLALLLALMMVLCCFAACGGDDDDDKDEKKSDKKGSSDVEDYAYAEALENYIDGRTGDVDAYMDMAPAEYWEEMGLDEDDIEDSLTAVDDVEIEIEDEEKMDEDDIADFVEEFNMHSQYTLDADDIDKAYSVEASISIEIDGDSALVENEWVAIKLDGEWYLATENGTFGM